MLYQVGDRVVHWNYGPGIITGMDEKVLAGSNRLYYVVEVNRSTLWVPADEAGEKSLRPPTPASAFKDLLLILDSPADELSENQYQRQTQLVQRMQNRTLEDICCILRDLTARAQQQKLNRSDLEFMRRAQEFLLDEWELSLGTPRESARKELESLLKGVLAAK